MRKYNHFEKRVGLVPERAAPCSTLVRLGSGRGLRDDDQLIDRWNNKSVVKTRQRHCRVDGLKRRLQQAEPERFRKF